MGKGVLNLQRNSWTGNVFDRDTAKKGEVFSRDTTWTNAAKMGPEAATCWTF